MSLAGPGATDPRYTRRGAIYVPAGEGKSYWGAGDTYTVKVDERSTNGSLLFVEATVPPGGGPEPHVHNAHDEAFYLVSGELEFLDGDQTVTAGAGGFFFVPRGTRHRFRNRGVHAARMIFLFTPGGIENLLFVNSKSAEPGVAPPMQEGGLPKRTAELMERYMTEMLPDR
ncbi:cupin domain-containing protein [Micromonospora sp. NPDC049559]|uniref:cupin domain-containing protein n=1 Tax=Micromonospora sp. NPDC049559 TaxID=3155923 RepID=UPI00341EFFE0